jgi:uncharacterized metal-binding protein YceD (DUF177 family)|tara:strand:- start:1224 stop:1811 length:588 start_codon:yes stop_codon:yes gene_type:complete
MMAKKSLNQLHEARGTGSGPLSNLIPVSDLSAQGRDVLINATAEDLAAISAACNLRSVEHLKADFHVLKGPGALLVVQGTLKAGVVQTCGVSLVPVEAHVEADIAQTYTLNHVSAGQEVEIVVSDDDPPEPVTNGQIDFGALALEHFILNLNPYPRAPGVQFQTEALGNEGEDGETSKNSPFSALAELKTEGTDR